jgi:hypothetical protein
VGSEVTGESVVVVSVRSGWDTELTQQRLDSLDSFRTGSCGWKVWLRWGGRKEPRLLLMALQLLLVSRLGSDTELLDMPEWKLLLLSMRLSTRPPAVLLLFWW